MIALVFRMFRQRLLHPLGKRFEFVVVRAVRGKVVAHLAPGDQLIQKTLRRWAHVPPAFAASIAAQPKFFLFPFLPTRQLRKDFMYRKMAEMKKRRKSAGNIKFWFIAFLAVKRQFLFKKLIHLC